MFTTTEHAIKGYIITTFLPVSFYRCYEAMKRFYETMHDVFWSKHTIKGDNKIHKEIAALIYHQEGKLPYAAILGTGTLHRDSEICAHESSRGHDCNHCTCDGHAESIVYEGAPKYFMDQMVHLVKEEKFSDSIFEKSSSGKEGLKFKLKPNIKFYLMVTDPPCGFIQNQKDPCMEWKVPFVGYPHIPTCSSRILIGATMGIQGYVSHLLEEPILIDTVIILCTKNAEHQRVDFGKSFSLPIIKTMKYNPKDFASFNNQTLIKTPSQANPSTTTTYSNSTSSDSVKPSKPSDGTKQGSLGIANAYKYGVSYLAVDPRTGDEISGISSFRIASKLIDDCLNIDKSMKKKSVEEKERMEEKRKAREADIKADIKKKYDGLCERLKLNDALLRLKSKLVGNMRNKNKIMASLTKSVSGALSDTRKISEKVLELTAISEKVLELTAIDEKEKTYDIKEEMKRLFADAAMISSIEEEWLKRYETSVESKAHNIEEEMKTPFADAALIFSIEKEWLKKYESSVSKANSIKEQMKSLFADVAMISNIENVLSGNKKLIMDCTWDCYFRLPNDTNKQPTDN